MNRQDAKHKNAKELAVESRDTSVLAAFVNAAWRAWRRGGSIFRVGNAPISNVIP